jgi:hypothetical protein
MRALSEIIHSSEPEAEEQEVGGDEAMEEAMEEDEDHVSNQDKEIELVKLPSPVPLVVEDGTSRGSPTPVSLPPVTPAARETEPNASEPAEIFSADIETAQERDEEKGADIPSPIEESKPAQKSADSGKGSTGHLLLICRSEQRSDTLGALDTEEPIIEEPPQPATNDIEQSRHPSPEELTSLPPCANGFVLSSEVSWSW